MEFDNKSFWKFTTALGRKLSDGRLVFYKIIFDSVGRKATGRLFRLPARYFELTFGCALLGNATLGSICNKRKQDMCEKSWKRGATDKSVEERRSVAAAGAPWTRQRAAVKITFHSDFVFPKASFL